ncbi:MAG: ankyrin repeat domain-containing protein [Legionellales bacterium]|jgi:hypothetical protein
MMQNSEWLDLFERTLKGRTEETLEQSADVIDALALSVLKDAIKDGYEINYQDGNDYTALAYAAEYNCIKCVSYLLKIKDIDTSLYVGESDDAIGGAAIHLAAFRGHLRVIKALLDKSPTDIELVEYCGYTPLHETILGKQYPAFKLLLKRGADEEALTEKSPAHITPVGMNTFQIIAYEAKTSKDPHVSYEQYLKNAATTPIEPVYKDMMEHLVLHKKAKGEDVFGNVPDTSDEESSYMDSEEDDDSDFENVSSSEDEDEEQSLVKESIKFFMDEQAEEYIKRKPWFYSASKVLNKTGRTDLKRSYDDAQVEYEINKKDGYEDNQYDSDSEEEIDCKPKKIKFNKNFKDVPEGTKLIASARGNHFVRNNETQATRKEYVKQSNENTLASWGMYSANTHAHAGVNFSLPAKPNSTREEKLEIADNETKKSINKFSQERNVKPVLQVSGDGSRDMYDSRLIEIIQRYVNSYHTFSGDIKDAQNKSVDDKKNNRTKIKQKTYQEFKGIPFVSTSEDVGVALEYSTAILNYDKKTTHQPTDGKMKAITLMPRYRKNGELHYPYLGVIFVTLHQQEEIKQNSVSVLDLFSRFKIDVKKSSPGSHESSGYVRALERIFFGGISGKNINLAQVVRLPNFYHPYRAHVVEEKYGLTEEEYNKFKEDLSKHGAISQDNIKLKNESAFYRTQEEIIKHVIKHMRAKIIKELNDWALQHHVEIGSVNEKGEFEANINLDITGKVKKASMLFQYNKMNAESVHRTVPDQSLQGLTYKTII